MYTRCSRGHSYNYRESMNTRKCTKCNRTLYLHPTLSNLVYGKEGAKIKRITNRYQALALIDCGWAESTNGVWYISAGDRPATKKESALFESAIKA